MSYDIKRLLDKINCSQLCDRIKNKSYYDKSKDIIVLGELIELKINMDSIDIYKYTNLDDVDIEEYDFDSDYITTIYL